MRWSTGTRADAATATDAAEATEREMMGTATGTTTGAAIAMYWRARGSASTAVERIGGVYEQE
ncbi:MAG TPA: hypothetical protein VF040_03695 [Ktedonobacterales bacterium]